MYNIVPTILLYMLCGVHVYRGIKDLNNAHVYNYTSIHVHDVRSVFVYYVY